MTRVTRSMADRRIDDDEGKATTGDRLANPLDALLGYRLRRASMTMMSDAADMLKPLNLSVGEASLLILIGANPGVPQSDVGRALEIKRANLTPLLARMKARGLVADTPIDGRSLSLALTESGADLAQTALNAVTESNHRLAGHLSLDERQALAALATLIR